MASSTKSPSRRPAGASRHVALLRGINVGGKNVLPMRDLVEILVDAGGAEVRSYIQSGNVVFTATPAAAKRIPAVVSEAIEARFGFRSPVIVRTGVELAQVAAANPFLASGKDAQSLHVAFLGEAPKKRRVAGLDSQRSPGDSFLVRGREIYLHLPNGVARTKLTNAYFDSALATTSTLRNWRTVLKLVEMASEGTSGLRKGSNRLDG